MKPFFSIALLFQYTVGNAKSIKNDSTKFKEILVNISDINQSVSDSISNAKNCNPAAFANQMTEKPIGKNENIFITYSK